jgi:hypothetical protein
MELLNFKTIWMKKKKLSLNKILVAKLNEIKGGDEPTHTACSNCTVWDATHGGTYCLQETEYPRCAATIKTCNTCTC